MHQDSILSARTRRYRYFERQCARGSGDASQRLLTQEEQQEKEQINEQETREENGSY